MRIEIIIPPEWALHSSIYTAWPSHKNLWQENLAPARGEVFGMIDALITPCEGKFDKIKLFCANKEALQNATLAFKNHPYRHNVEFISGKFGDIWFRDTAPIFTKENGNLVAKCFGFNGWGGKFVLKYDNEVNAQVAECENAKLEKIDFVLEGGSIDGNGKGVFLTTKECLLNSNRNQGFSKEKIEEILGNSLGAKKVIWLGDGLKNDHTDGHIDNIARFVSENKIICQAPFGDDDPNTEILEKIFFDLCEKAKGFEITRLPSPGKVLDEDGNIVPASHMNFLIGNGAVVVPLYGAKSSDEVLRILAEVFPERRIVGIKAKSILSGGGSFHCITQQVPT